MVLSYLGVFLAVAALDYICAEYTHAVTRGRAIAAGLYACGFTAASALITVELVADSSRIVAAGLGAGVGTAISVWRSKP